MPLLEHGDEAVYEQCQDPECPAKREGFEHAHCVKVIRAQSETDSAITGRSPG